MNYLKRVLSWFAPSDKGLNDSLDELSIKYCKLKEAWLDQALHIEYLKFKLNYPDEEEEEEQWETTDMKKMPPRKPYNSETDNKINKFIDAQTAEHLINESANEWSKRK